MIPAPAMMPLTYHWGDGYTVQNSEIMMSLWMVAKGGSQFDEFEEGDLAKDRTRRRAPCCARSTCMALH